MALASLAELKEMVNVRDTQDDVTLGLALDTATSDVHLWCGTRFEQDATATTRRFSASGARVNLGRSVFATTTGLVIATDDNDDGVAETTWTASDYELLPLDGVGPDGGTGWPYTEIRAVGSKAWPGNLGVYSTPVYVTAKWGWASAPAPVKYATLLLASDHWWSRNAPNGQSGFGDVDPGRLLRQNFKVQELLAPYRLGTRIVGIG